MAAWVYAGMNPKRPGQPVPGVRQKAKKVPQSGWQQGAMFEDAPEEDPEESFSEELREEGSLRSISHADAQATGEADGGTAYRAGRPARKQPKKTSSLGTQTGIHDEKDDWLSRQLKEEEAALWRVREMFGWPGMSDARALKMEHEKRHNAAKSKGWR